MKNNMKPIHILIIDDSSGDVMMIKDAIEERGIAHTISVANNGLEGIQMLEDLAKKNDNTLPDLILLDINMPKLNGHEVLDRIKSNELIKQVPVIMLTTSASKSDILKAYKKYSNCYIIKPSEFMDFESIIKAIENFWTTIVTLPS